MRTTATRTSQVCMFNKAVFHALHAPFSLFVSQPFSSNRQADLARQLERHLTIALPEYPNMVKLEQLPDYSSHPPVQSWSDVPFGKSSF